MDIWDEADRAIAHMLHMVPPKPGKPPTKQAPKVTVIRGKAAEREMAEMERAAKAQAKAKGKR